MNVIVVGAGIAGLSTAWSLVKAGHNVSIVEQGPIPNPLAASGDHHRIIRRAYGFHSADAVLALVMLGAGPIDLKLPHERTNVQAA